MGILSVHGGQTRKATALSTLWLGSFLCREFGNKPPDPLASKAQQIVAIKQVIAVDLAAIFRGMCHSLSPPLSGNHSDYFTIAILSDGVNGQCSISFILYILSVFRKKPCEKFPKMCLTVGGKAAIIRVNFNPMPNTPNALIGIWFGSSPMVQRGRSC